MLRIDGAMASARMEEARPVMFARSTLAALGPKCRIHIHVCRNSVPAVGLWQMVHCVWMYMISLNTVYADGKLSTDEADY